jgi:TDG/mug DNA glycosylase family protein
MPGLTLVFCGTAAGTASARRGHYYAGPGNRFWPMLFETGLTPRRFAPEEDHLLPTLGIGLTDLCNTTFGPDAKIPRQSFDPDGLFRRVNLARPRLLAFTSLTAARLALGRPRLGPGPIPPDARLPGTTLWALPSPSGLARATFDPHPWHALAKEAAR